MIDVSHFPPYDESGASGLVWGIRPPGKQWSPTSRKIPNDYRSRFPLAGLIEYSRPAEETMQTPPFSAPPKLSIREFVDTGYLQELNRKFLHPLGLALEVTCAPDQEPTISGVWDYRDDPEGIAFESVDAEKANRITEIAAARCKARIAALGYYEQPAPRPKVPLSSEQIEQARNVLLRAKRDGTVFLEDFRFLYDAVRGCELAQGRDATRILMGCRQLFGDAKFTVTELDKMIAHVDTFKAGAI